MTAPPSCDNRPPKAAPKERHGRCIRNCRPDGPAGEQKVEKKVRPQPVLLSQTNIWQNLEHHHLELHAQLSFHVAGMLDQGPGSWGRAHRALSPPPSQGVGGATSQGAGTAAQWRPEGRDRAPGKRRHPWEGQTWNSVAGCVDLTSISLAPGDASGLSRQTRPHRVSIVIRNSVTTGVGPDSAGRVQSPTSPFFQLGIKWFTACPLQGTPSRLREAFWPHWHRTLLEKYIEDAVACCYGSSATPQELWVLILIPIGLAGFFRDQAGGRPRPPMLSGGRPDQPVGLSA